MKIKACHVSDSTRDTFRAFHPQNESRGRSSSSDLYISWRNLGNATDINLKELKGFLSQHGGYNSEIRVIDAILAVRGGDLTVKVPSYDAFYGMLIAALRQSRIRGWLFKGGTPFLIEKIAEDAESFKNHSTNPSVSIRLKAYGLLRAECSAYSKPESHHAVLDPSNVCRRTIDRALDTIGLVRETPTLLAEYDETMERFNASRSKFGRKMVFTGTPVAVDGGGYNRERTAIRSTSVILDMSERDYGTTPIENPSMLADPDNGEDGLTCPTLPFLRVFDLKTQDYILVNVDDLEDYVYNKNMRKNLVLPEAHARLLDVMTDSDIIIGDDLIDGKKAPRILIFRGDPGLGKTLTAEAYSEITETPIYAIHAGNFGTNPENIERSLQETFARAARWGCYILIDECDVFVTKRSAMSPITQNAITAVFLRALEYYDGLIFMTTNRGTDIDDAILSRAAGVVSYDRPTDEERKKIWSIQSQHFNAGLSPELIDALVKLFDKVSGRDIRGLLTTILRVSKHTKTPISLQMFVDYAVFKNIAVNESAYQAYCKEKKPA